LGVAVETDEQAAATAPGGGGAGGGEANCYVHGVVTRQLLVAWKRDYLELRW
jgi:hypothetical protein